MNLMIICYVLGILVSVIGCFQLLPFMLALILGDMNCILGFSKSIVVSMIVGGAMYFSQKKTFNFSKLGEKDCVVIVSFGWIISVFFATFPFLFISKNGNHSFVPWLNFIDAYFEMMSGFTTMGASVFSNPSALPKPLALWRCLSQWMGGMGIVMFTLVLLPILGVGGLHLYRAEVTGPVVDKLMPRVNKMVKALLKIYVCLTLYEVILLICGGMDLFDALCHSFTTVSTGGFSTKDFSVGEYQSLYFMCVMTFFMFVSGISFSLHYRFLIRRKYSSYTGNPEFKFFLFIIFFVSIVVFLNTKDVQLSQDISIVHRILFVVFQVISVVTTTGYSVGIEESFHFGVFPEFSQMLFLFLMWVGGSTGSTAGGLKCLRFIIFFRFIQVQLNRFIAPNHVKLLQIAGNVVPKRVLMSTMGFVLLNVSLLFFGTMILTLFENVGILECFSAVLSCLGNIGPGLGGIGPDGNFSDYSDVSKLILSVFMLLGRLELYVVLALFLRFTWRKF